jgi:hypothetical protein
VVDDDVDVDDDNDAFTNFKCVALFQGTWKPKTGELDCDCKPKKKMTFANSFYVAPNKIDFSSVFLKFSPLNQAAVMAVLILIFIIYILIIIWTRRQDRKDLLKVNDLLQYLLKSMLIKYIILKLSYKLHGIMLVIRTC